MATATKDTKVSKKDLTLADREKAIIAKYGPGTKFNRKLVKGSLMFDSNKQKFTIELICSFHGCGERRRVATSDLHQVSMCEEHTKEMRNQARAATRNKSKKVKPAKAAKPVKAKAKPAKPTKKVQVAQPTQSTTAPAASTTQVAANVDTQITPSQPTADAAPAQLAE